MRRVVVLIVLVRVFAGCARPSDAVYQPAWDGEASQFEVPPARNVLEPDAGGGGSSGGGILGPGIGGSANGLPVCTTMDQAGCCYDGQPGHPTGSPRCTWQLLVSSAAIGISEVYQDDKKITAPVPLTLSAVAPATFTGMDDCATTPVGFVLSGPGVEMGPLGSTVQEYYVRTNGLWGYAGGGATAGLVAGRDTGGADGGSDQPNYKFGETLCQPPRPDADYRANVVFIDEIDFHIGGQAYTASFRKSPNGGATGYYLQVGKGW